MTYAINYQGLRQRQTYDELVDYLLDKQPKIIYSDRRAKFIRNSPQLSNLLDGEGMGAIYWEEQQINRMKEEQKEHAIRQAGGTAQHLRAEPTIRNIPHYSIADDDLDEQVADHSEEVNAVLQDVYNNYAKKQNDNAQMVQSHLSEVSDQHSGVLLGAEGLIKSSSSSSGSGNGDISSETFHSLPPTEQQPVYPFPYPSEQQSSSSPAKLNFDPAASSSTSRNPQEPKPKGRPLGSKNKPKPEASSSDIAYPHIEPPPKIEFNNEKDLLDKLFTMNDEQLKTYAIEHFGMTLRGNISTETLLGKIVKAQFAPPSAPALKLIKAEHRRRKRGGRINTP